jgi:hypothetical protein
VRRPHKWRAIFWLNITISGRHEENSEVRIVKSERLARNRALGIRAHGDLGFHGSAFLLAYG